MRPARVKLVVLEMLETQKTPELKTQREAVGMAVDFVAS